MSGRDRPDTQASMRQMSEGLDHDKPGPLRKMLSFQVFVSVLLIVLVLITGTAFGLTMSYEREARQRGEQRRELFENYVIDILTSVEDTQERGINDRDELTELIESIEEILDQHVEDGRIDP